MSERLGWVGSGPSAFPADLLRSGLAAFGQHLPLSIARLNVSDGWISGGQLPGDNIEKQTSQLRGSRQGRSSATLGVIGDGPGPEAWA
ncbi:MAG: hypothetical protein EKK43_13040 [Methylobacterium sp.]|uniref:hypothetical protein n=1 Tax=Methylobacterium sp. TaxID=409 RepID=UPI000FAE082A|nr:hypothetical protein [Methylobacterium sp.]RUP14231.1 MAG: hypothetical protein EKK43_13040 [Methylobacterium sp.]